MEPTVTVYEEGAAPCGADVARARFEWTKEKATLALDNERWKNRRRMAWISFWATMIFTAAMMFLVPEAKIEKLDEVVLWFYVAMTSTVGLYIGSATFSDIKNIAVARANKSSSAQITTPYDSYNPYGEAAAIANSDPRGDRG